MILAAVWLAERFGEQRRFLRATGRDKKAERRGYRRSFDREVDGGFLVAV